MNTHIETIARSPMAYIRKMGVYGVGNIQTMEKIKKWAKENHLLNDKEIILGIAHDNPQTTPPEHCRYDACILLTDHRLIESDGVQYGEMMGGEYAVFTVEHTAIAMEQAWAEIFPTLSEKGIAPDPTRPIFERYTAEQVANHLCEICVPIGSLLSKGAVSQDPSDVGDPKNLIFKLTGEDAKDFTIHFISEQNLF